MDNQAELEIDIINYKIKIRQLEEEIKDLKVALEDATRKKWRNGW